MNQAIGIVDSYVYRSLGWDIYVEGVVRSRERRSRDDAKFAAALPRAETCLLALENVMQQGPWLAGAEFTLADCHAAPMLDYFRRTPEGAAILGAHPSLSRWWDRIAVRASMAATMP